MTNPTGGIIKIQITRLTQNFCLFQDGEYLVACPVRFLLLYLIHRSLFLFRLSFPYFPFVIPVPPSVIPAKAGIQEGLDPQSEALRFRLRMTKNVSFPQPSLVIPVKTGIQTGLDPQSEALCFRLRMTRGFRLRMTKNVSFP